MVDLVKIRQKAKEKQEELEENAGAPAAKDEVAPAEPSTAKTSKPKTGSRKTKAPDKGVESTGDAAPKPAAAAKVESGGKEKPRSEATTEKPKPKAPVVKAASAVAERAPASTPEKAPLPEANVEEEPDEESLDRLARFKREAGKRRTWTAGAANTASTFVEEEGSNDLELLRFRLAGEEYAVDIEKIVEIVPPRGTTRVPNAEHSIVGIMSLRGTIVTVFDLRRKLGHPPLGDGQGVDRRMIVVEREGETAGFLVDKVSRVVKLDPAELENHPVVSAAEQSDYVSGVFQASDGLVILLDLEKILASQS